MSKRLLAICSLVLISMFVFSNAGAQGNHPPADPLAKGQPFVSDQILIRFQPQVTPQQANQLLAGQGLTRLRKIDPLGIHVLHLPPGLTVERAVEIYNKRPEVVFAEPNYILWAVGPDQSEINDQWGLQKIQAPEAWEVLGEKPPVVLGIVDTGIDNTHTDLVGNVWSNDGEIEGNGIDDDGNGKVDDTWGWDFVNNDNDPFDDNMHGTAVSSVAAGIRDDYGVAGVCPWCQVMAVKVLNAGGSGSIDTVAAGITYAAENGARVINLSLAGAAGSQALQEAVDFAWDQGALVVAAAGNDGGDVRVWPAAYEHAMAVGATNDQDLRACLSNYGEDYISVAAPGEAIYVATPDQEYGWYSGTSLATPHVTGLGGLLFSQDGSRNNEDVRDLIETTAEDLGLEGTDAVFGAGRVNALRAVSGDISTSPPPFGLFTNDLSATGYAHARKLVRAGGELHQVWHTRVGTQYQVLYSSSSDNGLTWSTPDIVFESLSETYHAALATDGANLYVAFPSKQSGTHYSVYFTKKPVSGSDWLNPTPVMGGSYNAVRPDIYYDPSNNVLHLVASSFDNANLVYYTNSGTYGDNWEGVVNVTTGASAQKSRYASVHAHGQAVTIVGRSVELTFYGLLPVYRVFTIQSQDGGVNWGSLVELASHSGWFAGEYGASLAGQANNLYLAYEHNGSILFRSSPDGFTWSAEDNLGTGAWPSITQSADGQAWALWVNAESVSMRHYDAGDWDPVVNVGSGNYPNLMLQPLPGRVEWVATHCSGAPFRVAYGFRETSPSENNPPVASDQSVTTNEDTPVAITLNGSDPDNDPLTYSIVLNPVHGILSGTAPDLIYTPSENYYGSDNLTFKVNDGLVDSNVASVSISVNAVNDSPVADDDTGTVAEDDTLNLPEPGVLVNDSDPDGDQLTVVLVNDVSNGTLSLNSDGSFEYSPHANFNGTDSFTYAANDGLVDSNPATVSIIVSPVNDSPVADDQQVTAEVNTPIVITLTGNDVDGDPFTYITVTGPSNGSLDGTGPVLTYTPDQDFTGQDSFDFMIWDGQADSNIATVDITIAAGSVHVGDLDGIKEKAPKGQWRAVVTITVHDQNLDPVQDATVYGTWSDHPLAPDSCVTLGDGSCSLPSESLKNNITSVIFTVEEIILSGHEYLPEQNHDPDPDSSGTAIQINQDGSTQAPGNTPPTAGFTYDCTNLTCSFDGSGSSDPDGSITGYGWDFGDGSTASGVDPSHTYAADGIYTVVLTVTDNDGDSDTETKNVPIGTPPSSLHVEDMGGYSFFNDRNRWIAVVEILIHAGEDPVGGATVAGTWSDGAKGDSTCITGNEGWCTVTKSNLKPEVTSVKFTVTDVSHPDYSYIPDENEVTFLIVNSPGSY